MDRVPHHEEPDNIKPKKQAVIAKHKHELLMHQQLRRTLTAPPLSSLRPLPQPQQRVAVAEMKLAAVVAELNVRARLANMPAAVQERAFRCARALIDAQGDKKLTPTQIAMHLKKEFDSLYGLAWHCIVGKSFGSFVTHSSGGFVYFSIGKLSFLLFKTEVQPVTKTNPLLKMK